MFLLRMLINLSLEYSRKIGLFSINLGKSSK